MSAHALEASEHGTVINTCSIFGSSGGFGTGPGYHAAKGAVRLMTKNAAIHWASIGVRVNSIHPGFIDTPMLEEHAKLFLAEMLGATPLDGSDGLKRSPRSSRFSPATAPPTSPGPRSTSTEVS